MANNKVPFSLACKFKYLPVLFAERIILSLGICISFGFPVDPEVCNVIVEFLFVHCFRNKKSKGVLCLVVDNKDSKLYEFPFNMKSLL